MIIAIYGIPRCGKDTFINEVLQKRTNSFHLKGSEKLNQLSLQRYDKKFKLLDDDKQKEIRVLFTECAKQLEKEYDLVIVDGHYAFPDGDSYKSVFTEADLSLYDVFFYLNRTPEEIKRNFNSGDKKDYEEQLLSPEKVEQWIEFEISNMKKDVEKEEKDLIVLDSDSFAVDYVCGFNKTSKEVALSLVKNIKALAGNKSIVLVDLDKTTSINDLTNDFIENSRLDSHFPKVIFKGDYYTDYQFTVFHKFLMGSVNFEESIEYAIDKLVLNNVLIADLYALKNESAIIAITTGMVDAWSKKNNDIHLFDAIFGFSKENNLVITPFVKKLVARYLSKTNKTLAIGDSIIDLGMVIEANKGYLVSMTKLDKRILKAHDNGLITKQLFQPKYSIYKYDFLKEDDVQW